MKLNVDRILDFHKKNSILCIPYNKWITKSKKFVHSPFFICLF